MDKELILLAKRPDLVLKLEKYHLLPPCKLGGKYEGCAKKWARERTPPYHTPETQALAERLPVGWEELSEEELNELMKKLEEKIRRTKKGKLDLPDRSGQMMVKNMAKTAFLGISTMAALIAETGLGVLPEREEGEKKQAVQLSFELLLHLVNSSHILHTFFKEVARTAYTTEKNQQLIADLLEWVCLLIVLLSGAKGKEEKLKTLMASFKETLQKGVKQAECFVSEQLSNGTLVGEKIERTALYLQQARIALEKEDFEGFYEALKEALLLVDTSPDLLIKEMKEIEYFADKLKIAFTTGMDAETAKITAISQVM